MGKRLLLRYDTEGPWGDEDSMRGFLARVVEVHRSDDIPATFFCTGRAIEKREDAFRDFVREVRGDPRFDLQDHSYSHVGLGYRDGKPVEVLRADYERSFAAHERVLGTRPTGISICGTGGVDGPRLAGFDQTDKGRAELDMVASLGVRMINTFLVGRDESREFANYRTLGHPRIMGFPSGYSDTDWMLRRAYGDPMDFILGQIRERAERNEHFAIMLHDFVAWLHAPDRALTHVRTIADAARRNGFQLVTHLECYEEKPLWQA